MTTTPHIDTADLPLDLLTITTPKGTARHLVSVEDETSRTLCGRNHGINPRYVTIGGSSNALGPAEDVTCPKCCRVALSTEETR